MSNTSTMTGEDLSLAERAYAILRDRLIMLDIAPGEPINEARVAAELGFGRTPLREALKRLETDHLVVSYPRRGTFATIVDITDLAAISEVRQVLEPLAARSAASNRNPAVLAELEQVVAAIESMEIGQDRHELMQYDLEVHRLIYRAAGNHHLEESLIRLDNLATRIWCLVLNRLPSISGHIAEHVDLLRAILAGDADGAAALSAAHVTHFERTVRTVL